MLFLSPNNVILHLIVIDKLLMGLLMVVVPQAMDLQEIVILQPLDLLMVVVPRAMDLREIFILQALG